MTREEKKAIISLLAEKIQSYPHFYITDTSTLNAEKTAKLRRMCFESQVSLMVVKNTLFIKALEQVGKADADLVKVLEGSSSVMFTENAKAPAVLIKDFRKDGDRPILKAAYVEEGIYVGDNMLEDLTKIKSKFELIGDVIGMLQSPAQNVISALQASAGGKIAGLVKAIEKKNN